MAAVQGRTQRQPHQLAFSFNQNQRSQAQLWSVSVQSFYSTTLQLMDTQTYKQFIRDAGLQRAAPATESPSESTEALDAGAGNAAEHNDGVATAASNIQGSSVPHIQEPVETLAVHYVVQLISLLGHFSKQVRFESASLVYQLASICDRTLVEKDLETILMSLETDDKGYYTCVDDFFKLCGSSFSIMVLAMVAGLECYYDSLDWHVRGICYAAMARLVLENEMTFLQEDHLAAIWNLYFSLNSIPLISNIFPDRIIILKSLLLLAPIFVGEDSALSCSVTDTLLRLKDKTPSEVAVIKATLMIIFERLCGKRSAKKGGEEFDISYGLFVDLISPHDEYAYDLLPWAFEQFTLFTYSAMTGNEKTIPIAWFIALNEFIVSLSNHFRATPALVRYGACLVLHSTFTICPAFLKENKQIWHFIIAGQLDTDYLSAFLYMSMLEKIETPDVAETRKLIARVRRMDEAALTYDSLYMNSRVVDAMIATRADVMDHVVKYSPPLSSLLLHKLANALDYLSTPAKLRQLEIIRVWGKKAEKLDTFLIQMLVPLCGSGDERVQLKTLSVIQSMVPGFTTASQADIAFVWTYITALLNPSLSTLMLKAALELVQQFPLVQLNTVAREELMGCLFKLIFHREPEVRLMVYNIINGAVDFWKISGQMNTAIAVLMLAVGDDDQKCAQTVLDHIQRLGSTLLAQILAPLSQVRDAVKGTIINRIKAYDQLATALALHKTDYRPLIDAMLTYDRIDEFWAFFLMDVPENQLAHPDEYNYSRNFVQSPFWISTLLTKFACTPPPLSLDPNYRREQMPTTPAGKRRFICGFMLCLLPTSGMPDMYFRRAACLALIRCCVKGMNINPGMLRGLLEYVSQQMLSHKHWSYQVSGLEILGLIVRLKVPGIAESVLQQYLDMALDFLHNSPMTFVKIAVLGLLEILLMVFPKAISIKLQEIRDITRSMLVDKQKEVASAAWRVYPLIFRAVSRAAARTFHQYLQAEIQAITNSGVEAAGDPLIASLTPDEASRIVALSILCIGMIPEGAGSPYSIAHGLMKFAWHDNPEYRASTLTAILSMLRSMEQHESLSIVWMILPLYADPNKYVRLLFVRFLRNMPSMIESKCQGLPQHPDDMPVLPLTPWEEILTDTATIGISSKSLQDLMLEIDALNPYPFQNDLPADDDGFHLPTISEKLMARYKVLAQATTSVVPPPSQSEVIYFLQEMQKQKLLQPNAILVLAEFCSQHESTLNEICDALVNHLGSEFAPVNLPVIEACVLGLNNIATTSAHVFKEIIAKITLPQIPNEGDLLAMLFMIDSIKTLSSSKVPEILAKLVPIISSQRHAMKKRMFAAYLGIELCLVVGQDEVKKMLDAVNMFMDSLEDKDLRRQIHQATSRILAETGPKHPFFKNMIAHAKKDVKSKTVWKRMQALNTFRLFVPHMTMEDCMWFIFHLLSDSNEEIRRQTREVVAHGKIVEFAYPTLQRNTPKTGRRAELMARCKLPAMDHLGATLNPTQIEGEQEVLMPTVDPFNAKYYSSTRRQKFTQIYGLNELQFAKVVAQVTRGVLAAIEERASNNIPVPADMITKTQWILKLEPSTILHDLIGLYPSVASEIMESLLAEIEATSKFRVNMGSNELLDTAGKSPATEEEGDIEAAIHKVDVTANLLIAHDGIGNKIPVWLKRFQNVITFSCNSAKRIRESLFTDIERSLYFFNDHVDIPIVSDEQFEGVERLRLQSHEATLEIVKSGKTDKLSKMDGRRIEMNESVDIKVGYCIAG
eukprot:jgi/Hompol1/3838/HPOL_003403-RA